MEQLLPSLSTANFQNKWRHCQGGYYSGSVIVSGNYLYGAQLLSSGPSGTMGFSVYDISNPLNPILVGSTVLSDTFNNMNMEMRISWHYVYLVDDTGQATKGNI